MNEMKKYSINNHLLEVCIKLMIKKLINLINVL